MKKVIAIIGITITSTIIGALAFFWYATAKAEMEVVANNAVYLKQQLFKEHYQLAFDYDKLSIGSHFLRPKIVMKNPVLKFSTGEGMYRLTASQIYFIGAFGEYNQYQIVIPETIMLEKTGDKAEITGMTVSSFPEVKVKSSLAEEKQGIENTILDQILLERGKNIVLEFPAAEGGKKAMKPRLVFTPPPLLTAQWNEVRYQIYPYLTHFAGMVEKVHSGTQLP